MAPEFLLILGNNCDEYILTEFLNISTNKSARYSGMLAIFF